MRIDNSFLSSVNTPTTRNTSASQDSALRLVYASGTTGTSAEPTSHVPAPEVQALKQSLASTPDLRQDRIAEVAQKLANGYYLTPQAASWTAGAILQSGE